MLYIISAEESDDFYEFSAEDYYRSLGTKKKGTLLMNITYNQFYLSALFRYFYC